MQVVATYNLPSLPVISMPSPTSPMFNLTKVLPSILANAITQTKHSWEYGALTQSLLEVYHPMYTTFAWDAKGFDTLEDAYIPWEVLEIANKVLKPYDFSLFDQTNQKGTSSANPAETPLSAYLLQETSPVAIHPQRLLNGDGSLGDPASVAPAVWLLANFADKEVVRAKMPGLRSGKEYAWAVGCQWAFLLEGHRDENGM
jgi:hypothetical protein